MTPEAIYEKLKENFGDDIIDFDGEALDPYVKVAPARIFEIATFLRQTPELDFSALMCLSGMDYGVDTEPSLGVVYNLHSIKHGHKLTLRVELPRENPRLPSVETVWRTADWHEREAFDLLGIVFEGHRDLRRILCPDDWEGYPLRKDYVVQEYYHGVRVPYQEDWNDYKTLATNPERGNFVYEFESKVPDLVRNGKNSDSKARNENNG